MKTPFTSQERMLCIGINRILIVSCHVKEIAAAMRMSQSSAQLQFQFFITAEDAIKAIGLIEPADARSTLVITDLDVEVSDSGLQVVEAAFSRQTVAFVTVPSTSMLGGLPSVRLMPCFESHNKMLLGTKEEVYTWLEIFKAFYKEAAAFVGFWQGVVKLWKISGDIRPIIAQKVLDEIRREAAEFRHLAPATGCC